jgi:hypothetical protein
MKTILYLLVLTFSIQATAQTEEDALRYSQSYFGGSAKNNATAGAMSAIGGDFSTTSQNPSSMARFNKNNFVFTPVLISSISNSNFYDNKNKAVSTVMKVGNISYLKSYKLAPERHNGWMSFQMGAGYNRINSFENQNNYRGEIDSSILDYFTSSANGTDPDDINYFFPYTSGLAYETYAIDPDTLNSYTSGVTSGNTIQNRTIYSTGSMGEFSLAISGNYKNKLYIGGTINAVNVNYRTNFVHVEDYTAEDSLILNGINYRGALETEGWGYNAKLGLTYIATPQLSLGVAFHTPTLYKLTDNWSNDMVSLTDNGKLTIADENKPSGEYQYKLNTPLKTVLSAGYIIKKKASIGVEIELINYKEAKLNSINSTDYYYSFTTENNQIENIYHSIINYKIGGEYRLDSRVYLRGGYAYYSSPYTKKSGVNTSATQFITTGAGLNYGEFYFDFAVVSKLLSYDYYAYNPELKGSKASFTDVTLNFSASIGVRF